MFAGISSRLLRRGGELKAELPMKTSFCLNIKVINFCRNPAKLEMESTFTILIFRKKTSNTYTLFIPKALPVGLDILFRIV